LSDVRLRLVSSIVVAALCAAVFQFRTYTSFERERIRVVKDPLVAHEPQLTLPLPDLSALRGTRSALILRLRGTSEAQVTVALGERTLGRVDMPAGREVRADLTFIPDQAPGATLTLASRGTGWTVSSRSPISTVNREAGSTWSSFQRGRAPPHRSHPGCRSSCS
jgi:hypothetical protein